MPQSITTQGPDADPPGRVTRRDPAGPPAPRDAPNPVPGATDPLVEPTDLASLSDAALVDLARGVVARVQHGELDTRRRACARAEALLHEARHRGEPRLVAWMLRAEAMTNFFTPGQEPSTSVTVDELLVHAKRHGLAVFEAASHGLRGRAAMNEGDESGALAAAAVALAIAEPELEQARARVRAGLPGTRTDPSTPGGWLDTRRLLTGVVTDIASALIQLGVHEHADELMAAADEVIRACGTDHEIAVHLLNRVDLLTGWGLRLERVGRLTEAMAKHREAAEYAGQAERYWQHSLFSRGPNATAADELPAVSCALAIAGPHPGHLDRLRRQSTRAHYAREVITLAIASARCLEAAGHRGEAVTVLADTTDALETTDPDNTERTLRLSLARELARLAESEAAMRTWAGYATAVEFELWALREARQAALYARLEHERLSREHGAVTRQALQDPLTGLPNRRALDSRLAELLAETNEPHAVAMIDLDGFKAVNDRFSHAEGDSVLLSVATTLVESLRDHDVVARYGGDEFVVLLPMTTLRGAERALARAVSSVAGLAPGTGRGVTLSIGVVTLAGQTSARRVLAEADAAMYLAKRGGGNRVIAAGQSG